MRPAFLRQIDRRIFRALSTNDRAERILDVALAVTIALSLAAVFWG